MPRSPALFLNTMGLLVQRVAWVSCLLASVAAQEDDFAKRAREAHESHSARMAEAETRMWVPWQQKREEAKAKGDVDAINQLDQEKLWWTLTGQAPSYLPTGEHAKDLDASQKQLLAVLEDIKSAAAKSGAMVAANKVNADLKRLREPNSSARGSLPALGTQLLNNPSCEKPARNGKISGWTVVEGEWLARSDSGGKFPGPKDGKAYFSPGAFVRAELAQQIDLRGFARGIDAGLLQVVFGSWVASYKQDLGDKSQVVLEFLGEDGAVLATAFDSQAISTTAWREVGGTFPIEPLTRSVRARMISVRETPRRRNEQVNNDGYHDAFSLRLVVRN